MLTKLSNLMHTISDHGDAALSKFINIFGVASVGGGAANYVVSKSKDIADPSIWTIPDYAGVVSIVGGVVLIVKLCSDMYFNAKRNKREKENHKEGIKNTSDSQ